MVKRLTHTGSTLRPRDTAFKAAIAEKLAQKVWPLIEAGTIAPVMDSTFPLADAAKAHARMESSGHIGKNRAFDRRGALIRATAVWLVDNTSLSFDQIADFCNLHPLEVKAIADGEAAQGIKGLDPVMTGQLSREEIDKAQANTGYRLKLQEAKTRDAQIMRLVGTTKPTIQAIRERTHWNSAQLTPMDPVTLGLSSQIELDMEVEKASKHLPPKPEGEVEDHRCCRTAARLPPKRRKRPKTTCRADPFAGSTDEAGETADGDDESAGKS
eukprot:jgi/Tetstr1/422045/TSEL_012909.t1